MDRQKYEKLLHGRDRLWTKHQPYKSTSGNKKFRSRFNKYLTIHGITMEQWLASFSKMVYRDSHK